MRSAAHDSDDIDWRVCQELDQNKLHHTKCCRENATTNGGNAKNDTVNLGDKVGHHEQD